jgi:hypothetical protein
VTEERIKKLRALAEAATRGPWHMRSGEDVAYVDVIPGEAGICELPFYAIEEERGEAEADARFIAAARTALPEALDEIEKLRGLLEETVASVVLDAARSRDTGDTVSAVECEDIAMRIRNALRGVK